MTKNISLSMNRDIPILQFLWRWKLSTTAALSLKFFPDKSPITAYKRLWTLKHRGFIQVRADSQYRKFVWMLDKKGYAAIKETLPVLRSDGYRSESIGHDLLVNAVHLGEWLTNAPTGVGLFSEQQLRSYHFDHYPAWAPKTDLHRPDGYWKVPAATGNYAVALEVELTPKRNVQYEIVGSFYSRYPEILRALWIVPRQSMATNIHEQIAKALKGSPSIHDFVTFGQFQSKGWNARIEVGIDQGKTIANILGNRLEHSSKHVSTNVLLDTRKTPHRSKASAPFAPGDFSDRLGSNPSSSPSQKGGHTL